MNENKFKICEELLKAVQLTRAGEDISGIHYDGEQEIVMIIYNNGYAKPVNVACDSGIALMRDVLKSIN